ncbi:hypothetical protein BJY24_004452 [Nocardia transvalensis]|uniref:DUF397 domain-containing protein n=1 Tax=Nocardia transvalensis TaxID=37333 RepID=A0A7W9UKB4_9NOCA|nr:DUF397 domain-containing protein [Nocardia transvalensis]MBB5915540.1 hypothetical protein [Nocardia transvalensis]
MNWFKSSRSQNQGQCVEVAWLPDGQVGVRDSKNPDAGHLTFTPGEWDAFTARMESGEFKRPNA